MKTWATNIFECLLLFSLLSPAPGHSHEPLTRETLNERLSEAIEKTKNHSVVLEDLLGEGPGHWDADPRYPDKRVNCMIWLQLVLAEAYGQGLADKTPILDKIRYYGGHVAFGMRKHYTDHWLKTEPEPLKRVSFSKCGFPKFARLAAEPEKFLKHRSYSCPLYRIRQASPELEHYGPEGILNCAKSASAGFYFLFAIPTDHYEQLYLQQTGKMGLVHAMILEIPKSGAPKIHHASTTAGKVLSEPLETYFARMKNLHRGYVAYEAKPDWDFQRETKLDAEGWRIRDCESKLPVGASH